MEPDATTTTTQTTRATGAASRSDATRERILDAAFDMIRDHGGIPTVAQIAAAAGVSRQLVYLHFESRAGLLAAMTRRYDRVSGYDVRIADAICLPPVEAIEQLVREWLAYLPLIQPVANALEAARVGDLAGAAAWQERMAELRSGFEHIVCGLRDGGALADGWTVERATDWAWGRCHLTAWQHMVIERGWPQEEFVERCVRSIMGELVRPDRSREAG